MSDSYNTSSSTIVARAPADGYTLRAAANGTVAIAPHFLQLSYSVSKDLTPVALMGKVVKAAGVKAQ